MNSFVYITLPLLGYHSRGGGGGGGGAVQIQGGANAPPPPPPPPPKKPCIHNTMHTFSNWFVYNHESMFAYNTVAFAFAGLRRDRKRLLVVICCEASSLAQ